MDVDARLRAVFVELADGIPGGRKALGFLAMRVTKAAAGTYTPRPSDFVALVRAGANPHRVSLALLELVDVIVAAEPEPDLTPTFALVARASGEAAAACAEYVAAPSAATERAVMRACPGAVRVLTMFARRAATDRRRRATRTAGRTRTGVLVEVIR